MTGSLKMGGMIQRREHSYAYSSGTSQGDIQGVLRTLASMGVSARSLTAKAVYDRSYGVGKFLDGAFPAPYAVNVDLLTTLAPAGWGGISMDPLASRLDNYDGYETKSAGYAMATLSVGDNLTIVPGVRYQNLTTHYTGFRGMEVTRGIQGKDTTVSVPHGLWLPMVHVKYQPTDWLQVRWAYTNTLVYSDYSTLSPRFMLSLSGVFAYDNYSMNPATSENMSMVVADSTATRSVSCPQRLPQDLGRIVFWNQVLKRPACRSSGHSAIHRGSSISSARTSTTRSRWTCMDLRPNGRPTSGTCPGFSGPRVERELHAYLFGGEVSEIDHAMAV